MKLLGRTPVEGTDTTPELNDTEVVDALITDDEAMSEEAETLELLGRVEVGGTDVTSELAEAEVAVMTEAKLEEAETSLELGVADPDTLSELAEA